MVEQASLQYDYYLDDKDDNNKFKSNFFRKTHTNSRNRFFYLELLFHARIFSILKYNKLTSRYFYSHKTVRRLRYLNNLNSKQKPR